MKRYSRSDFDKALAAAKRIRETVTNGPDVRQYHYDDIQRVRSAFERLYACRVAGGGSAFAPDPCD